MTTTLDDLEMCDVQIKFAVHKCEKEATQATLDWIRQEEQDEQAAQRKGKEHELQRACQHEAGCKLAKEGAQQQEEYNHEQRASGACPNPITDPLGWCEYEWSRKDKYKSPAWAGDLWSTSPMDHQQLAARMVCSWGLVKAYQQSQQSVYICPPTPHILEAYNHKVNHDTHKELNLQECAVLQYACTLQYVSSCNNAKYRDRWAPAVKDFWVEVVKSFRSRALCNLDPSNLLGDMMCLNRVAKIPDYGVHDHIAHVCAPFFEGIESRSQYENRRCREEEHRCTQMALGDHCSPSHGPNRRTWEWDE